jgi:hypothetical protein
MPRQSDRAFPWLGSVEPAISGRAHSDLISAVMHAAHRIFTRVFKAIPSGNQRLQLWFMKFMANRDIVAIGGSLGALEAVQALLGAFVRGAPVLPLSAYFVRGGFHLRDSVCEFDIRISFPDLSVSCCANLHYETPLRKDFSAAALSRGWLFTS